MSNVSPIHQPPANQLATQRAAYFLNPEANFSAFQVELLKAKDSFETLHQIVEFQKNLKLAKKINNTMRFKYGKTLSIIQKERGLNSSEIQDLASKELDVSGRSALTHIQYFNKVMELAKACHSHGLEELEDPSELECILHLLTLKVGNLIDSKKPNSKTTKKDSPNQPDLQPKVEKLEKANTEAKATIQKLEAKLEAKEVSKEPVVDPPVRILKSVEIPEPDELDEYFKKEKEEITPLTKEGWEEWATPKLEKLGALVHQVFEQIPHKYRKEINAATLMKVIAKYLSKPKAKPKK